MRSFLREREREDNWKDEGKAVKGELKGKKTQLTLEEDKEWRKNSKRDVKELLK